MCKREKCVEFNCDLHLIELDSIENKQQRINRHRSKWNKIPVECEHTKKRLYTTTTGSRTNVVYFVSFKQMVRSCAVQANSCSIKTNQMHSILAHTKESHKRHEKKGKQKSYRIYRLHSYRFRAQPKTKCINMLTALQPHERAVIAMLGHRSCVVSFVSCIALHSALKYGTVCAFIVT